jgi:hypothetical protein
MAWNTLVLALVSTSTATVTPVLLGRGDYLTEWSAENSATISISQPGDITPWSGLQYLNFSFTFAGGGWQTSFGPSDSSSAIVPLQRNLSFAVLRPPGASDTCVNVGVTDATKITFENCFGIVSGWQNFSIALETSNFWSNGHNLTLPIQGISIGVSNPRAPVPGPSGWLGFADVAILSGAAPGAIPRPLFHQLVQVR